MANYYLAADGGGTKTDVICADEQGTVIGKGSSGPTNLTSTSVGAASFNLNEAVRQALEPIIDANPNFVCFAMGLAGLDTDEEIAVAKDIFVRALSHYNIGEMLVVNDSQIALENGSSAKNAVVLISGTGSIAYGRNEREKSVKTGGMDYLLTDQGSGYYIGRQVLREAVKSYDGRREKTVLEHMVCEYFRINSIAELKQHVYNPPLTKIEVAQLAKVCSQAYQQGDEVAADIFDHAIDELELHVQVVIEKLGLQTTPFELVLSGAVVQLDHVQSLLLERLKESYPNIKVITPTQPPVFGALKLALGV